MSEQLRVSHLYRVACFSMELMRSEALPGYSIRLRVWQVQVGRPTLTGCPGFGVHRYERIVHEIR